MADTSHVYADGSQGFFRYSLTDGTHSHVGRQHVLSATIDNVTDPGSPTSAANLISPEADVNATARNFLALLSQLVPSTYTIRLLDFQPVSGGVPSGPVQNLQPYSLTGLDGGGSAIPEAQVTRTFRDGEGAPYRYNVFGGGTYWSATARVDLAPNWATNGETEMVAYLVGLVKTGTPAYAANMTKICSHHGSRIATALHRVGGLNRRLRRSYHVI